MESKEFKGFFEAFFLPVCRLAERYVGEEEAADVAQDAFLKTYEEWRAFEGVGNAKAFVYTVARRGCLDWLKHRRAREHYAEVWEGEREEAVFLEEVTRQEMFRILREAVGRLPGQTRRVVELSMEGKTVQEVGEVMGVSPNTVKTLKKNAYAALREMLAREYVWWLAVLCGWR